MIFDAWMQQPNADFVHNAEFDSLQNWRPGA